MRVRTKLILSLALIIFIAIVPISWYLISKLEEATLEKARQMGLAECEFLARSMLNLLLTNGGDLQASRVDGREVLKIFEALQEGELNFLQVVFLSRDKEKDGFILVEWPSSNRQKELLERLATGFKKTFCRMSPSENCLVFEALTGLTPENPTVYAVLEFSESAVLKPVRQLKHSLLYSVFFALFVVLLLGVLLNLQMMKPLRLLERATQEISQGNLDYRIHSNRKDEFGKLARSFNQMSQALKDYIEKLDEKYRELSAARSIQQALLPSRLPVVEGFAMAARYSPMDLVGGDIYDVILTPEGFAVVVIDVSGHGVPAALITGMAKMVLLSRPDLFARPAEMINHLNNTLVGQIGSRFLTLVYAHFFPDKGKFVFANGGHPDIILINKQNNSISYHNARGGMVGSFPDLAYEQKVIALQKGQRFIFLTDGILECSSPDGKFYEEVRLTKFLNQTANLPVEETCDLLMKDITEFHKPAKTPDDDATVLIVDVL